MCHAGISAFSKGFSDALAKASGAGSKNCRVVFDPVSGTCFEIWADYRAVGRFAK
jgi:hypothetical protein